MSINEIQLIHNFGEELLIIMLDNKKEVVQRTKTIKNKELFYLLDHFGQVVFKKEVIWRTVTAADFEDPKQLHNILMEEYERNHRIRVLPFYGSVYVELSKYWCSGSKNEYYGYFEEINKLIQQLDLN